ncbi:activating signal cointegrator 1 [Ostrinia nubilalis]|uniref:activating signal cointegrator 1 n=1 Tax=Ostrinia nubilalis TaxID=29057 RepID=UPI0030822A20
MEQWLTEGLSRILGFQVPEDLISYVLSIENEGDLNEYLKTLLDFENPQHKNFVSELVKRKFPSRANSIQRPQKKKISKNKQQKTQDFVSVEAPPPEIEPEAKSKKKTKFVNLYSQEGKNAQVVLLKGRNHCDCQASKHELINNCLQCGRVVCKQEGSGPCLFCGNLVCTPEEQKELNLKTKASAKLKESLMERARPQGWQAALSHRDRLLEYDRTSERRTHVTDDDSDYFSANSVWLNAAEKEKLEKYQQTLHEKKHVSRLAKKMTFDFAGRQVVEDNTIDYDVDEDKIREMSGGSGATAPPGFINHALLGTDGSRDVAPGVNASLLQFDSAVEGQGYAAAVMKAPSLSQAPRVQDPELQEMSDTGRCLSMHQPWASLLVDGIKMCEGQMYAAVLKAPSLSQATRVQDPELQEMSDTGRCLSMHQPWASLLVDGIKMRRASVRGSTEGGVSVPSSKSSGSRTARNERYRPLPLHAPALGLAARGRDQDVSEGQGYVAAVKSPSLSQAPRVQDPELQEMSDTGRCLSMHQPWASLLVDGIKMHEGRTWYSSHRGRLWIASTAKPPDQDTIRALENQYRVLYPEKQLQFPSFYPTGCLLGCVTVDDCLPQEDYQKKYPDGESDSPYVFICSNPVSLRLRFPIKGQHKIYALDKTIHHAAMKCIQKMSKIQAGEANADQWQQFQ